MEHHRKAAKALLRGYAAGEPAAVARAEAVLGNRVRQRFQLSDAQHVVAREQGYRSWAELKHSREEKIVDTGLVYREGEPVLVRIRWRAQWVHLDDQGVAAELAGRPPGWLEVAERIVAEEGMNVSRRGVVFVGGNRRRDIEPIVPRLAETSLAVYAASLELSSWSPPLIRSARPAANRRMPSSSVAPVPQTVRTLPASSACSVFARPDSTVRTTKTTS